MTIKTLVIGFVPLTDTSGKKPRQVKEDAYMKALFAEYDFGEVHYAEMENWKAKADEVNPLFIILLGNDYYGREVHEYKKDALLHTSYDAGQIFYRKAETEERIAEQRKTFTSIAGLVKKVREDGDKEVEALRNYAAMSYNDIYDMIKKALISDDKKLHDDAWDLLFGKGERNSDLVWMRMQFLCETWEHADGKGKEELMCLAMEHMVSDGMARKLDTFTDLDGQQYHQYMFCDFFGCDINYIRRIPFGEKGQEKYAYERMLTQYETPANFMRVMVESTEMRRLKEEHFKSEAEKVTRVLKDWKQDPTKSKKELGVVPWVPEDITEDPLTERELSSMKNFLKKHDPVSFGQIFAEEPAA